MAKVLMFHRVLPAKSISLPNAYSTFGTLISQEYFEEILTFLITEGFQFYTISDLLKKKSDQKDIALTFDDGYSDNYEYVLPILKKYNVTATFFPLVEPCKTNSVLPLDIYYQCVDEMNLTPEQREDYITGQIKKKFYWSDPLKQFEILKDLFFYLPSKIRVSYMTIYQLKAIYDSGFEIGSHGMNHSILTADYNDEKRIIKELAESKNWLELITGNQVNTFCFPAGRYNASLIENAKKVGYTSTCLVFRNENEKEALPSFDRIFVKPDFLNELKSALSIL